VVVWGTPLGLVATAWLRGAGGPDVPLVPAFWTLFAAGLIVAAARPGWIARARLRTTTFAATALTGLGHLLILRPAEAGVVALDLAMIAGGAAVLVVIASPAFRRVRAARPALAD
jgi:hypothetical protein